MINFSLKIIQSTKVQLLAILLTTLYAAGLLIWQYQYYRALEVPPAMHSVDGLTAVPNVEIGLHINSFPVFSLIRNEFVLDGSVWFRYNPKEIDQNIIEQFTIENALSQNGELLLYKSTPIIRQEGQKTTLIYNIQTTFKASLNHSLFPTGDHTLNIILQNKAASSALCAFTAEQKNCTLSENLLISNWYPRSKSITTGFMEASMQQDNPSFSLKYPCAVFTIDFQNMTLRDVISIYFPLFVLFLIGLLSLTIDILEATRLNLIIAAVPVLVLFRMVIDARAPNVGYSMQVDHIYHLLVFLSLLILFFQMYVTLSAQQIKQKSAEYQQLVKSRLEVFNSFVLFIELLLLVGYMTYLSYIIL